MKITRINLPKSRVKLTIEVPSDRTDKYFDDAYKKLAPAVEIKGFRAGQAPRAMTLESIGFGRYSQTAMDIALPETYYEAIQKEKIIPVQPPAVSVKEFSEGKPLIYEAEVDIVPMIKLCEYNKIKVKYQKPKLDVKKEELDKIFERLRYQAGIYNNVERAAKNGDRVEIDFEGLVDNVRQDNLTSKNHPLILGEGTLIPGFEKELIGMKKGDEKEFDIDVPHKTERGMKKKAHFKTKMLEVKEVILPELGNDFAKKFGHDDMEKLTKAIEEKLLEEKKINDKQILEKEVLGQVVSKCELEIPESLIEQETMRRISQIQSQMGQGFTKYLESIKKSMEDLKKDLRSSAIESAKTGLIIGEIAKSEGFLKSNIKDQKAHEEVIRKTVDFLVKSATN